MPFSHYFSLRSANSAFLTPFNGQFRRFFSDRHQKIINAVNKKFEIVEVEKPKYKVEVCDKMFLGMIKEAQQEKALSKIPEHYRNSVEIKTTSDVPGEANLTLTRLYVDENCTFRPFDEKIAPSPQWYLDNAVSLLRERYAAPAAEALWQCGSEQLEIFGLIYGVTTLSHTAKNFLIFFLRKSVVQFDVPLDYSWSKLQECGYNDNQAIEWVQKSVSHAVNFADYIYDIHNNNHFDRYALKKTVPKWMQETTEERAEKIRKWMQETSEERAKKIREKKHVVGHFVFDF